MKGKKVIFSLFVLVFNAVTFSSVFAQKVPRTEEPMSNSANLRQSNTTPEERIVRMAYRKMNILDAVERFMRAERNRQPAGRELGLRSLRFNLRDFRVGEIQEIQNTVYRDLVTPPTGEIIQASIVNSAQTSGETKISLDANWRTEQSAPGFNPLWTIGNILQHEAHRFGDVGKYASYEVTVSLDGRTRTYRALTLFHNLYQPEGILNPEFLDSVVGLNGVITQVSGDTRLPLGMRPSSNQTANLNDNFNLIKIDLCSNKETDLPEPDLLCEPDVCVNGGGCLEWYYTPIDPSYTYCMVWDPYYYGGGGGGVIQGGSNTILYRYVREEIDSILGVGIVKRCIYTACADTDRNPSNGCFYSSYETFTDIRNTTDTCASGIRATYRRYRIPIIGITYCDRVSHDDLPYNPCNPL